MFGNFVKFEFGLLLGTLLGATVSAIICSIAFNAFGFDNSNVFLIQDCLQQELKKHK
jgi:hypothetical protein